MPSTEVDLAKAVFRSVVAGLKCFYGALPQESDNLCHHGHDALKMLFKDRQELSAAKGAILQKGSLVRRVRRSQSEVWEFRWREPGPYGYTAPPSNRRWFNRPNR